MRLLQTGGIVGRTWFLETLLPSGRKHRAPGYERPRVVFWERYVFDRGSYPKIFGLWTTFSCPRASLLNRSDSTNLVDEWTRSGKLRAAVNHAAKPMVRFFNLICLLQLNCVYAVSFFPCEQILLENFQERKESCLGSSTKYKLRLDRSSISNER
jgi:hypothetical protein